MTSAMRRVRRCKKHEHLRPVTVAAAKPSGGRSMATVVVRYGVHAVAGRWGKHGGAHSDDGGKLGEVQGWSERS